MEVGSDWNTRTRGIYLPTIRRRRIPGETLPGPDIDSFAAVAGGWKLIPKRACGLLAGPEVQRISEVLQRAVVVEGVGPLALEPQPA
jgi:hypothetical protein